MFPGVEKMEEIKAHPLYRLKSVITGELRNTFQEMEKGEFQDNSLSDYYNFLQQEAETRIAVIMGNELDMIEVGQSLPDYKYMISDPTVNKKYEEDWKKFISDSRNGDSDEGQMIATLKNLADTWVSQNKIFVIPAAPAGQTPE